MANIIVTSKNTDIDNYYYPDFINVIINNGEFVIPRSDDKVCIEDIDILENDVDIKFSIFPSSIILNNKFHVSYNRRM